MLDVFQIITLDMNNAEDCARKFRSNRQVGAIIFLGCLLGTWCKLV